MGASFTPDILRMLRDAGCTFVRHGKGDHDIWFSPISGDNFAVDGKTLSRHTANGILRSAGLPKAF